MMKKFMVILAVAMMVVLMAATAVYAEDWGNTFPATHYGFTGASEGCAGCHITHYATAKKLLKSGRTQTDFCYSCHGSTTSSPYNVEDGKILESGPTGDGSTENDSTAGKFDFYNTATLVTSRHDVDSPSTNTVSMDAYAIPGNTVNTWGFSAGFKCGSCHDVHAGEAGTSDRLLKRTIFTGQGTSGIVNFVYDGPTLLVTKYAVTAGEVSAINDYCGLCHSRFNIGDDGAKGLVDGAKQTVMGTTYYRHPVGVPVAFGSTTLNNYLGNKDDAASGTTKNIVLCLTCHYAHGTTKAANVSYASWSRDPDAKTQAGGTPASDGTGSVLLRMDGRAVCYDCHGAATKNTEAYGQALQ